MRTRQVGAHELCATACLDDAAHGSVGTGCEVVAYAMSAGHVPAFYEECRLEPIRFT